MKKLLAFILCLSLLCSFLLSCSSDDSSAPDDNGQTDGNDTPSDKTEDETDNGTFKRFIPAAEGDPDEEGNPYREGEDLFRLDDHLHECKWFQSVDEINAFISESPTDIMDGVYHEFLSFTRREGYFLVPHLDGKSLLDNDGLYKSDSGNALALCHSYYANRYGRPGYSMILSRCDNEDEIIYINVYCMKKRYVDYARTAPILFTYGTPNPDKRSDEKLIESTADQRTVAIIEGRETVVEKHITNPTSSFVKYVSDAGYYVMLYAYGSETIDSLDIAKRLSFEKVPLTETETEVETEVETEAK